jgi:hypothetical protein
MIGRIILFVLIVVNIETAVAEEISERFHFLLNGIRSEREKLVYGIVRGSGQHVRTIEEDDGTITTKTGPVEYFFAFDYLAKNFRIDRKEADLDRENPENFLGLGQYIERTDAIEYHYRRLFEPEESGIIFIATPKEGNYEFRNNALCYRFDIRALGLNNLAKIRRTGMLSLEERLDSLEKKIPNQMEEVNGICRFEFSYRDEQYKETRKNIVWVDTKNGYTIQRSLNIWELDYRKDQPWIISDQRLSWKKIKGVWIPVDVSFETNFPINKKEQFVLSFDWENINKPVDEDLFHYCDFSALPLSSIVDVPLIGSQGKSKHHGNFLNLCGTEEGRLLEKQLAEQKSFSVRFLFIISGIVLIIISIILKIYKK